MKKIVFRIITGLVIYIFLFIVYIFISYQCPFYYCKSDWKKVKEFALYYQPKDYRIDYITADVGYFSLMDDGAPTQLDLTISYTSTIKNEVMFDNQKGYKDKHISVGDRLFIPSLYRSNSVGSDTPTNESKEMFLRVKIHPRDAIKYSWYPAINKLLAIPTKNHIHAYLIFGKEVIENYGHESIWAVWYNINSDFLTVFIDAQTGEVIEIKDPFAFVPNPRFNRPGLRPGSNTHSVFDGACCILNL